MSLTADVVRARVEYDAAAGTFHWRQRAAQCARAGAVAGTVNAKGYRYVKILGKSYRGSRLAWLIVTGQWPDGEIDHVNGMRSDDRFENLRDVTHATNVQNMRRAKKSNRSTGTLGVTQGKRGRPQAIIRIGGKAVSLGHFDSVELAHQAYLAAKRQHHPGCTI